jgi:hypothetical protein
MRTVLPKRGEEALSGDWQIRCFRQSEGRGLGSTLRAVSFALKAGVGLLFCALMMIM